MPLELPTIGPRELELLRLLWQHGPSSVRELRDRLDPLAYTTAALLERAETAERAAGARPLLRQRRPLPRAPRRRAAVEYRGKVCRVCGRQAPPPSALRHDDLRVCRDAACRTEARRRDNLAKQNRHRQRKLAAQQRA